MPNFEQLETHILNADFNQHPEIADLFAEEFREIAPNGEQVRKESVLKWLSIKDPNKQWQLTDFESQQLSEDIVHCLYKTKSSVRSSIWKNFAGKWQMIFAQGTLISKT